MPEGGTPGSYDWGMASSTGIRFKAVGPVLQQHTVIKRTSKKAGITKLIVINN